MKKILTIALSMLIIAEISAQAFATYTNPTPVSNVRTAIRVNSSGDKWYSSSTKGLFKYDGANWFNYNISNSGIATNYITDLNFDSSNNLWASSRAGLIKFDGSLWSVFNVTNSGIANDTANCVFVQGANIWVGTRQGLSVFNGSTWTTYTTGNSGILHNNVTALNIDAMGNVWVGTLVGLSIKSASGWSSFDGSNGFASAQVSAVLFENASVTWVGTKTYGLYKFENNIITSLSSIVLEWNMHAPGTIDALSKGPQGGVLYKGSDGNAPGGFGFYEIVSNQKYFYPFPSGYNSFVHTIDAASKVWFAGLTGNSIFSFDLTQFSGTITIQKKEGIEFLDVNQVRAGVLNRGDMHWDLNSSAYEVPKNSGIKAIFASSIWMGGLDAGNNLHQAAMTYRQTGNDYWPGPLDTISGSTDSSTSTMYDKIWKLDRWQIDEFRTMFANGSVTAGTYTPALNIINWPAHGAGAYTRNMAPFVDVNSDGVYDPLNDGDYPKIKGDQMCYWIFNDALNVHTETGGSPLKVEVHASAYAYACDTISDNLKTLNYTIFYNFDIFNRSSLSYHDMYLSLWHDGDLGGYMDDYVGCNRNGNYSFQYNADDFDESQSGVLGYGANPPMISTVILNGPEAPSADGIDNDNDGIIDEAGEKNLMTGVLNYNNNNHPVNGNPGTASDFYNYTRNRWRDGSPTVYSGSGTGPGTPYNYMYDGVPGMAGWSEATDSNSFVDRRINTNCGPFNFSPSQMINFSWGIVFTRDDNPVYSIQSLFYKNQIDVQTIRQWYNNDNFPSCEAAFVGIGPVTPLMDGLKLYPNPLFSHLFIEYSSLSKNIIIEIYDMRGLLVTQMQGNAAGKQLLETDHFASGLYIVKINDNGKMLSKKFLKN
ncbi:MAG TPA: T9SS type A sorting domain-containing protein [Bacteroidia bacterium]|jgi:hypothetical protein